MIITFLFLFLFLELHGGFDVLSVRENVTLPLCHCVVADAPDLVAHKRDETLVVTHHKDTALEGCEGLGKTLDSLDIKMIGRLIEEEDVGLAHGDHSEDDTALLTTREGVQGLEDSVSSDTVLPETIKR